MSTSQVSWLLLRGIHSSLGTDLVALVDDETVAAATAATTQRNGSDHFDLLTGGQTESTTLTGHILVNRSSLPFTYRRLKK